MNSFIDIALKESYRSKSKKSRHGAVCIVNHKVISKGYNYFTSPHSVFIRKYANTESIVIDYNKKKGIIYPDRGRNSSLHAEIVALKNLPKGVDPKKITMVIVRTGLSGNYLNSKPCASCEQVLSMYGVKKIYYS